MHGRNNPTFDLHTTLRMKRRAPLQKYGAPLYGVAWPDGPHAYMAGGGNLGIENKCAWVVCMRFHVISKDDHLE